MIDLHWITQQLAQVCTVDRAIKHVKGEKFIAVLGMYITYIVHSLRGENKYKPLTSIGAYKMPGKECVSIL